MSYPPPPNGWPGSGESHPHQPYPPPPSWPPPPDPPTSMPPVPAADAPPVDPFASAGAPPGVPLPPDGPQATPPPEPPPRHNGRRLGVIAGVVALVLLAGVSILAVVLFTQPGGSADDRSTSSPSPSESESGTEDLDDTTGGDAGPPADQAVQGDCLDKPADVTDTKIVDCHASSAAAEVVARADDPDADNTKEAAAAECDDTDSDYTIYLLEDDADSERFVLCIKEL